MSITAHAELFTGSDCALWPSFKLSIIDHFRSTGRSNGGHCLLGELLPPEEYVALTGAAYVPPPNPGPSPVMPDGGAAET